MSSKRPFRVKAINSARGFLDTYSIGSYATRNAAVTAAVEAISTFRPGAVGWTEWCWKEVWLMGGPVARIYTRSEKGDRYLVHEQPGAKRVRGERGVVTFVAQERRPVGEGTLTPVPLKPYTPRVTGKAKR